VNQVLYGRRRDGKTPVVDLFTWPDSGDVTRHKRLTARHCHGVGFAPGGNGNALRMAALESSAELDDRTFAEYYGDLAAKLGRELSHAKENDDNQQSLLSQAVEFRDDISRVSLDEEAIYMLQFQRAYQATAKLLTTLSDLTEVALGLIR
jgi:flagellar hook-associated protein 1 FlgK